MELDSATRTARAATALGMVVWFLAGLVLSAVLIVVIPLADFLLLIGLIGTVVIQRFVRKASDPRLLAMVLGAMAFSTYTLAWVLTNSGTGTSTSTGLGLGVALG